MSAKQLLDTAQPFNEEKVKILDMVVAAMYSGDVKKVSTPNQIGEANQILEAVQADPNFWVQCDSVLRFSQNWNTKFLSLLAVEDNVKVKTG